MFALTAIGALLFFLPGLACLLGSSFDRQGFRQHSVAPSTTTTAGLTFVILISVFVHLVLTVAISLFFSPTAIEELALEPTSISPEESALALLYSFASGVVGSAIGMGLSWWGDRDSSTPGSLRALCDLDRRREDLSLIAYAYTAGPGPSREGGLGSGFVGGVMSFTRGAGGEITRLHLVQPSPFIVERDGVVGMIREFALPPSGRAGDALGQVMVLENGDFEAVAFELISNSLDAEPLEQE